MADKLIGVGFTKKAHGAQGELKITLKDEYFDDFVNADVVFINVQGKPLPFFIESLREAGDILLKRLTHLPMQKTSLPKNFSFGKKTFK